MAATAWIFDGATHWTLTVVASIRDTVCAVTLTNENEQVQSLNKTGNENADTMKVSALPPYALTAVGEKDASKGTSEASSVNENVEFRKPSRAVHET